MALDPTGQNRSAAASRRAFALLAILYMTAGASASAYQEDACEMQMTRQCCSAHDVVLVMGCAPKQRIPLDLGPGPYEIFVDGDRVDGKPSELALRADQYHVVFVKRDGHVPRLVVFYTESQNGTHVLTPTQISMRLARRPGRQGRILVSMDGEGE